MKKIISLLFAVVLVCGVMTGCVEEREPERELLKVDNLGMVLEDGKTVTVEMDRDAAFKSMGEPSDTYVEGNMEVTTWNNESYTSVEFRDNQVLSIFASPRAQAPEMTIGISCGNSIATVKDALGTPMRVKIDQDKPEGDSIIYYGFHLTDGRYEQVATEHGSWETFHADIQTKEDIANYYVVILVMEPDKVKTLTIESFARASKD